MRIIKFRAWDKKEKKMFSMLSAILFDGEAWACKFLGQFGDEKTVEINNLNLMQYTGLRDKNGVEIYEGDILERYSGLVPKGSNPMIRSAVTWHVWHWEGIKAWKEAKVIGNIYENPELTKP